MAHLDDVGQVVHEQRRAETGNAQQHQIDRAHPVRRLVASSGQHDESDRLDDRRPEVGDPTCET